MMINDYYWKNELRWEGEKRGSDGWYLMYLNYLYYVWWNIINIFLLDGVVGVVYSSINIILLFVIIIYDINFYCL